MNIQGTTKQMAVSNLFEFWPSERVYLLTGREGTPAQNTARIQALLDSVDTNDPYASPAVIKIPAGYWTINDTLKIRKGSTIIRGDGPTRTIIQPVVSDKDAIGFDGTGQFYYCSIEHLGIVKNIENKSVSQSCGINLKTAIPTQPKMSRLKIHDVSVTGFYYGIAIEGSVGVLCERVEAYGNNYAFDFNKVDSAILLNCNFGDAVYPGTFVNKFGESDSIGLNYRGATMTGFSLTVIGGESRLCNTAIKASCGTVGIFNHHTEFMADGPIIDVGYQVVSAVIEGTSWNNIQATNKHPAYRIGSGLARAVTLRGGSTSGWSSYPILELNHIDDWIDYTGNPLLVTNRAKALSNVTLNGHRATIRPGANVTVTTNAPYDWTINASAVSDNLLLTTNLWFAPQMVAGMPSAAWQLEDPSGTTREGVAGPTWYKQGGGMYGVPAKIGYGLTNNGSAEKWLEAADCDAVDISGHPFTLGGWFAKSYSENTPANWLRKTNEWKIYYAGQAVNRLKMDYGSATVSASEGPTAGWNFVLFWYDGTNIYAQINNAWTGSAAVATPPTRTANPVTLLKMEQVVLMASEGLGADELFIYQRVLNVTERNWLWNSGAGRPVTGTVAMRIAGETSIDGDLRISGRLGLVPGPAPVNTTTVKGWVEITNMGGLFKIPIYQ